jgi:hypothetical protein
MSWGEPVSFGAKGFAISSPVAICFKTPIEIGAILHRFA